MKSQMDFVELLFVCLVLAGLAAWSVTFFVQSRLPGEMRGLWPSSFRAISSAARDSSSPFRRQVLIYIWSGAVFALMMLLALVAWQFVDTATKA